MQINLSRAPRLHTTSPLQQDQPVALSRDQAHYLGRVLHLVAGDKVRVFNGDDGEWLAQIEQISKRGCIVRNSEMLRQPQIFADIDYLFAPLKTARLDYLVQKMTEMGAARLRPVLTELTQTTRVNMERLIANTIEAAEQCNLVAVPTVSEPEKLDRVLDRWATDDESLRQLIFCDEAAASTSPLETLKPFADQPLALLIGPEGGFSERERQRLLSLPFVTPISLGPRIMRADTAAVAAMAVVQATVGDWR